jgi:hypothetical protein
MDHSPGEARSGLASDNGGAIVSVGRVSSVVDRGAEISEAVVDPMLAMIERALLSPGVAIDKLERVIAIADERRAASAKQAFHSDFSAMQAELPVVEKGGAGHNGRYARQQDIVAAVRPVLSKFGFAISHRIAQSNGSVTATAVLSHRAGHSENTSMTLPMDKSGGKTDVHATASSVTYATRYTTIALLGIASSEDDDGKAAGAAPVEAKKLADLQKMIAETDADVGWICQRYSVEALEDLTS